MGATATRLEAGAQIVDAEALAELRLLFGPRAPELLARSRAIIAERAAGLPDAAAQPTPEALGRLAHEIAGMAGQLGLRALAAAAARTEALCAAGDRAGAVASASALVALSEVSLAALPEA